MNQDRLIHFEWVVPESERDEELRDLDAAGGKTESSGIPYEPKPDELQYVSFFEPMLLIVGAASTVYLIRQISRIWRDHMDKGGVIVDAREGKLCIRRVPSLDRGTLIILTESDTVVYRPEDESDGLAALNALFKNLGS